MVQSGLHEAGGLIISSSQAITEAEPGPYFARAAQAATCALADEIREAVTMLGAKP